MSTTFALTGQVLTSSALTPQGMLLILQPLAMGLLGQPAPYDYSSGRVRLDWQTQGQPAPLVTDDICSLRAVEENSDYAKIRDEALANSGTDLVATYTYQRQWRCSFSNYGPHAEDSARLISEAIALDWVNDSLALSGLYVDLNYNRPVYLSELKSGQWWQRCDLHICLSELVSATITVPSIASLEIQIYDPTLAADFIIQP